VARGPEGALGREAAEVDLAFRVEPLGKRGHAGRGVLLGLGADRAGGTGDEGHQRADPLGFRPWLPVDDRQAARPGPEVIGVDHPAGPAIDAGGIDEERAGHVLGQPLRDASHAPLSHSFPRALGTRLRPSRRGRRKPRLCYDVPLERDALKRRAALFSGPAVLLLPAVLRAQAATGSLDLDVHRADGGPIAGAEARLEAGRLDRAGETDERGRLFLAHLRPGAYRLRVSAPGFTTTGQRLDLGPAAYSLE